MKSRHLHLHLLALEAGRDAEAEHHRLGRPGGLQRFLQQSRGGALFASGHALGQNAPPGIGYTGLRPELVADPLQGGDRMGGGAIVVAKQHLEVVGIGADDGDLFQGFGPGQGVAFVLEQHQGGAGGLEGEPVMFRAIVDGIGYPGVRDALRGIEFPEPEAGGEEAFDSSVDLRFGDQPLAHRLGQGAVLLAAAEVAAGYDGAGRCGRHPRHHFVAVEDIRDGPAVGDDIAVEAPLPAQDRGHQQGAAAAGFALVAVIGAHDRLGSSLAYAHLKGGEVGFAQVAFAGDGVEAVALRLGTAVHGVVFGSGDRLEVARIVALEALDKGDAEAAGEEGILAVGLLAAAPARIAEDVDVRRPEGEPLVNAALALADEFVVLGASLVADHRGDAANKRFIPGGPEPDGLGKDRGDAGPGDPVQGLVPPVAGGDAEAGDG